MEDLLLMVRELRTHAMIAEQEHAQEIAAVRDGYRESARNLTHYMAMRTHDVRELQRGLALLGLSSLGRSESCVLTTLERVDDALRGLIYLRGEGVRPDPLPEPPTHSEITVDAETGPQLLHAHAVTLLGNVAHRQRATRIMVTMPSEAAERPELILQLLEAGMDIMRVNCAHDGPDEWLAMVRHMRAAEERLGVPCLAYADLGGPKLRTDNLASLRLEMGERYTVGVDADIPVTIPGLLDRAEPGHRIWFDDGKIGAVVVSVEGPNLVTVEITRAKPDGTWLKPEKGINLADTPVAVDSLTEEDVQNLRTMAPLVNVIGMSFIRSEADVSRLFGVMEEAEREGIGSLGVHQPGVVLKIETRDAFERLPQILLQALRRPPVGIMVARGDLAVEVGYDRLAEIQEEILWIAEAAHVPVIWATQVLDGMARKGIPTRAEVSDTVMSGRAECVMLNKGLYIVEAVRFLDNVLRRMADHQDKKRTLLRKLRVSEQFYEG